MASAKAVTELLSEAGRRPPTENPYIFLCVVWLLRWTLWLISSSVNLLSTNERVCRFVVVRHSAPGSHSMVQVDNTFYRVIWCDVAFLAISIICYALAMSIRFRRSSLWFFKLVDTSGGRELLFVCLVKWS